MTCPCCVTQEFRRNPRTGTLHSVDWQNHMPDDCEVVVLTAAEVADVSWRNRCSISNACYRDLAIGWLKAAHFTNPPDVHDA